MASFITTAKTLQKALEYGYGEHILITKEQFYSRTQERVVNMYVISKAIPDEENSSRSQSIQLFRTARQVDLVLFLRDYLFEVQGKEVPTDNEDWVQRKHAYYEREKNRSNK